jgi:hypothetical protein
MWGMPVVGWMAIEIKLPTSPPPSRVWISHVRPRGGSSGRGAAVSPCTGASPVVASQRTNKKVATMKEVGLWFMDFLLLRIASGNAEREKR